VRDSFGGVDRGSTLGNVYKGSFTNAAKPASPARPRLGGLRRRRRLRPRHRRRRRRRSRARPPAAPQIQTIPAEDAAQLRDEFDTIPGDKREKARALKMKLGSKGVSGVGSVNQALAKLTPALRRRSSTAGSTSWAEKAAAERPRARRRRWRERLRRPRPARLPRRHARLLPRLGPLLLARLQAQPERSGWSGSGRLTGISTVVAPFDWRPDNLMRWVERLTLEGVARGFAGEPVPADPHELRMALERGRAALGADPRRGGRARHRTSTATCSSCSPPATSPTSPTSRPTSAATPRACCAGGSRATPSRCRSSRPSSATEHGCAGRMDLRFRITDRPAAQGRSASSTSRRAATSRPPRTSRSRATTTPR
jgi:hypothetical protein